MGYSWKRVRLSLKKFRNQQDFELKQAELNTLIQLHKQGYLDLYFADESHFGLMPNVPYAWQHKNEPILLPSKKAARLTTFGLMTIDCKANFHTCLGSLDSTQLIHYMDHFCQTITKKTIVVLDNAPTHRSKLFKAKIGQWEEQDLYIFFLPAYSPELNKIEILWRFIKYKWLPFEAFISLESLYTNLEYVLRNIGEKYDINFIEYLINGKG